MKIILLATLIILMAIPARAQSLKVPTAAFIVASQADAFTTFVGQRNGHLIESDPIFAHMTPGHAVAIGAAMDAAQVAFWLRVVAPHHRKIAAAGLYLSSAFRIEAAVKGQVLLTHRLK